MKKPQEYYIPIKGYEMVEKIAKKSGYGGYIYVPAKWAGKKVAVVLLEEIGD
jgi:putative transposon-encoded protein